MSKHPLTAAVGVAACGVAAAALLGGGLTASAGTPDGPLQCAGDRVQVHHVDIDEHAPGPLEPVTALAEYLSWRGLDLGVDFESIRIHPTRAYYGAMDGDGRTIAIATVDRNGASWRVSELVACTDVLAAGGVR